MAERDQKGPSEHTADIPRLRGNILRLSGRVSCAQDSSVEYSLKLANFVAVAHSSASFLFIDPEIRYDDKGVLSLTKDLHENIPPYAILSHTWDVDNDAEVTFDDLKHDRASSKPGFAKIKFCADQAKKDGIEHCWVDTCCINKADLTELSRGITSMFRWYRDAAKCYVYLSDVSTRLWSNNGQTRQMWQTDFRASRWFKRGWTLQELLAPKQVLFFSQEEEYMSDRETLAPLIRDITGIPITALCGTPLSQFSEQERMDWAEKRETKFPEDKAYCLQGIFDVFIPLIYGEGSNAFLRLQDVISQRAGLSGATAHVHWIVDRSANPLFEGRQDLLRELDTTIREAVRNTMNNKQTRIVISGLGGQGKSEMCLQLAHRLQQMFWAVLWIDVSTPDLAEKSFLDIAQRLSLSAQSWQDARLRISNLKYPWLLILDNADDLKIDYLNYFPDGSKGVVLLTTRNDECFQYSTTRPISLEGLTDEDARRLLLKAARVPPEHQHLQQDDADTVAKLLKSHPLALIQAGAYITQGHSNLASYPGFYEAQRRQLLAYRPKQARSRYGDVYSTFEVSAEILKVTDTEAARDALQMIPLLAVCAPRRLPIALFRIAWKLSKLIPSDGQEDIEDPQNILLTPWHTSRVPSILNTTAADWDPFRLMEAISLLKALSLITVECNNDKWYVSAHDLVHAWARDRQTVAEQHDNWIRMGCVVALVWDEHERQREYNLYRELQPHIEAFLDWDMSTVFGISPSSMVTRIYVRCGSILWWVGGSQKVFATIANLFSHLNLQPYEVNQQYTGLYQLWARYLINSGQYGHAVKVMEEVIKFQENSYAEDNPVRLDSQIILVYTYRENQQLQESLALSKCLANIAERALPRNNPKRMEIEYELANALNLNGQVREAVSLLENLAEIQTQSLPKDHPDRVALQHALAVTYRKDGRIQDAIRLLEQMVKFSEQWLREDQIERLTAERELAISYRMDGRVQDAIRLLEHVVKIREQSLPEDHRDRLSSQHELAVARWYSGDKHTAVGIMTSIVDIRRRVLDETHPSRQASENWLAYFHKKLDEVSI